MTSCGDAVLLTLEAAIDLTGQKMKSFLASLDSDNPAMTDGATAHDTSRNLLAELDGHGDDDWNLFEESSSQANATNQASLYGNS